jgi:hypothetical protein
MKIYEVKNASGKTVNFARSFEQARAVVREDSPTAKKVYSGDMKDSFSNGFNIYGIDIKPDKEGILSKLNSLLGEEPSQSDQPEPTPEPVPQPVAVETTTPIGISPAIEFTGKGQGTCLHCNKTVGYVGGFPRINPPEEVRDQ